MGIRKAAKLPTAAAGEKELQWNCSVKKTCRWHVFSVGREAMLSGFMQGLCMKFVATGGSVFYSEPFGLGFVIYEPCLPNVYQKLPAKPWGARGSELPVFDCLPRVYQVNFFRPKAADLDKISGFFALILKC